MKPKDVVKLIEKDGWKFKTQKGSHRHFVHDTKIGKVTIPMRPNRDLDVGTLNSILKQAGLK